MTLKRPTSRFGSRERDETLELFSTSGLELSAFAYYENDLHPDPQRREEIATHLRHAIDAASSLGVPYVGNWDPSHLMWIGVDRSRPSRRSRNGSCTRRRRTSSSTRGARSDTD